MTMSIHRLLVLIFALLLVRPALAETLLIAAGAGYKRPVSELSAAFEKKTGFRVEQIYGHMGGVISQAKQSGQVAVIFGDLSYLSKAEGIAFSKLLPLGDGRLVVAWPKGSDLKSPAALTEPRFARIAIPDTKSAIYGIAATEFIQRNNLAAALKDKLQVVATVPQVSAYLISGEVDAGFINLTEALGIKDKIGGYLELDQNYYNRIRIVGGVVDGFGEQPAVLQLQQFVETPEARSILEKHGL
jgi:molybdate transport system substrate-binding protein